LSLHPSPNTSPLCLTLHRITLSARASTLGEIVTLICFAVFRLITNSNFVGCSTGRSAGLAPLRILSTQTAARRTIRLDPGLLIRPALAAAGFRALGRPPLVRVHHDFPRSLDVVWALL